MAKSKNPTAEELLQALEDYEQQLLKDPKISATKFHHMQTAIYGAKCLIRDAFGIERVKETAWVKKLNTIYMNNALHLFAEGNYAILKIEVNGKWVELIKERLDSPFSHIIEPIGIKRAVEEQ